MWHKISFLLVSHLITQHLPYHLFAFIYHTYIYGRGSFGIFARSACLTSVYVSQSVVLNIGCVHARLSLCFRRLSGLVFLVFHFGIASGGLFGVRDDESPKLCRVSFMGNSFSTLFGPKIGNGPGSSGSLCRWWSSTFAWTSLSVRS